MDRWAGRLFIPAALIGITSALLVACAGGGGTNPGAVSIPTAGSTIAPSGQPLVPGAPSATATASAIATANGFAPTATAKPSSAPTVAGTPPASTSGELPRSADAFVDSAGVNVHLSYGATVYATNFSLIAARLAHLNVRHIRDSGISGQPAICLELQQLATAGMHLDMIVPIQFTSVQFNAAAGCAASAIEFVEGPNEIDLSGIPNWDTALAAYQPTLYAEAKALGSAPVIAPALTTVAAYAATGSLMQSSDYGNMHDYYAGHNPGSSGWGAVDAFGTYGSLPWNIAVASQTSGSKPMIATETGYSDSSDPYTVPAAIKARYLMRTLLEHWNAHVARTYFYELADEGAVPFSHYGLLDANGNAKPGYTALANMLGHDGDPGGAVALTPLSYTISGPASVHHTLLERRNGTYLLTLWNEVPEWDPNALVPIAVGSQTATLTFASVPSTIAQTTFDDSGNATTASIAAHTSVTIHVTGSPAILDISR